MNAMAARLKRIESTFKPEAHRGVIFKTDNTVFSYIETSKDEYTEENFVSLEAAEAKYPGVPVFITGDTETIAVIKQLYREG